ncbi:MAG: hypothetical protein QNJ97_10385 [Myxococcota bacterium]|nr:hypothetical protein [Myxococcota bacterium]
MKTLWLLFLVALISALVAGCGECETSADCSSGMVCAKKACIPMLEEGASPFFSPDGGPVNGINITGGSAGGSAGGNSPNQEYEFG